MHHQEKHFICLLVLSADNLFKQFGNRGGPTKYGPDLDPNCLTLVVFLKKNCKKQTTKRHASRQQKGMQNFHLGKELTDTVPYNQLNLLYNLIQISQNG